MARFGLACLAAGLLLVSCVGDAQAWRLFPSFSTGFWNETVAKACPTFNASEPDPFQRPAHPEHDHSSIENGVHTFDAAEEDASEPPEPKPPKPHPHPPGPHPPRPPRPFPGPPFYHGAAGPRFHVTNRTCGYETRKYNASSWAITNSTGWSWEFAVHNGFRELDPYFHGENANATHFPPSLPVASSFVPRKNFSDCGKQILVGRYVPRKCHSNSTLPAPNNDKIKIYNSAAFTAYVRTFPGLGLHWAVLGELRGLAHDLKRDGINVKQGKFIAAQYDPPTAIFHRHNEVWFIPEPNSTDAANDLELSTLWGMALDVDLGLEDE